MSTTVAISPVAFSRIYNNRFNNCPLFSNRNVVRKCEIVCRRLGGHGVSTIAEFKSTYINPRAHCDECDLHSLIGIYFLFTFNNGMSRRFIQQFDEKIFASNNVRQHNFTVIFNQLIGKFNQDHFDMNNLNRKINEFKLISQFFIRGNVPAVPGRGVMMLNVPAVPRVNPVVADVPAVPRVNPVVADVPAVTRVNRAVTSNGGRRFRIRTVQLPRNQIIADAMSVINDELNRVAVPVAPRTVTVNKNVIPEHIKIHLRAALVATRSNRCPVCFDDFYEKPVTDCVVTDCGHYICAGCHAGCMNQRKPQCCECRAPL